MKLNIGLIAPEFVARDSNVLLRLAKTRMPFGKIEDGRVTVDGEVELRKGCKIRLGPKVEFDSHVIEVN